MYLLSNFEQEIDEVTLKKAKAYFKDGLVQSLEQNDFEWTAEVEGSDNYCVEITLSAQNEIMSSACDCPHNAQYCKHIAAVLIAIKKEISENKLNPEKKSKKDVFEALLQKVSIAEYQEFIRQLGKISKAFKTDFELYFADKDERIDISKKYQEILKSIINKHKKQGYIDYYSSNKFANDIEKIIETAKELNKRNNVKDAFSIAKVLLPEIIKTVEFSDDSNGYIGGILDEILGLINSIATRNDISFEFREQVFHFCSDELNKEVYFGYGNFGDDLLDIYKNLAIQLSQTDAYLTKLDLMLSKVKEDSYNFKDLIKRKLEIYQQNGRQDLAEGIIAANLQIVDIRMNVVKNLIAEKNYKKAKELLNEGIAIAEKKDHPGTVNQWERLYLEIAYLENDINTIKRLTKYFAFDRGVDTDYYNQWKKTFTEVDWRIEIDKHIEATINKVNKEWKARNNSWRSISNPPILHSLAQVYILENYLDRLIPLLKLENDLNATLQFNEYLSKDFSNELIEIYLPAIKEEAVRANDRNKYADLVRKMKKIIKEIPSCKAQILTLGAELKMQYSNNPKRPAMIEELNKLF